MVIQTSNRSGHGYVTSFRFAVSTVWFANSGAKRLGEFDLDHFEPVACSPEASLEYDNLVYSCHTCNLRKGKRQVPDPARALLESAVRVHLDGRLSGLTDDAHRVIMVMGLNSANLVRRRLTWMRIIDICQKNDPKVFASLMSYPEDIPDLSVLTPPNNTRPEGVERSYFAMRAEGTLSDGFIA